MNRLGSRKLILNVNVLDFGHAGAARKLSDLPLDTVTSADYYAQVARTAERGTLDAFFLADHPSLQRDPRGRGARALEPSVILAAAAEATSHIGLVGTLSTTYNDPAELAERFLALDHLSGGRAAWNAVTTYSPEVSQNFGLSGNPDRDTRYRRASEFVDVVLGLWRGAVDNRTWHHSGEFFQVDGRLGLGASPQGHPLLVQAGGSPQGRELAARSANAVFAAEMVLDAAVQNYELVKQAAVRQGRRREDVAILPGLVTIIGSTHAEAREREARQRELAPGDYEVNRLSARLGFDLSQVGLDDPLPTDATADLAEPHLYPGSLGFRQAAVQFLRLRQYTVREAIAALAGSGHSRIVGTPKDIADFMETWLRAGAADGFNLMPDVISSGLEDFVEQVVPELRTRGLFRHEYEGQTLRQRWS